MKTKAPEPHIVILGGGFGGLYAAKALRRIKAKVTLIDRRNFHLFQPLLYQVATGTLSPGEIAAQFREVFSYDKNISFIRDEIIDIDPANKKVIGTKEEIAFDRLIVACGSRDNFFSKEEWASLACPLKTIEDALTIRRNILSSLEAAEIEPDHGRRQALMTFVIIGGGSTGVELAGTLADLTRRTLKEDFRNIDPAHCRIILIEAGERILGTYRPTLSEKAKHTLQRLGVEIKTHALVTSIKPKSVIVTINNTTEEYQAGNILWAAGVKPSPLAQTLHDRTHASLHRSGRVIVEHDFSLPGHPEIFVIGDLCYYEDQHKNPLPGLAQVAIQEGKYVAKAIRASIEGTTTKPFKYRDYGQLSVIGRNAAIAQFPSISFDGLPAWCIWALIHIWYLIGFDQKIQVFISWAWNYLTHKRSDMLITGEVSKVAPQLPQQATYHLA